MAGKKPASLSAQRSNGAASSPKNRPEQASKASAAGAKVRSPVKPRKISKEKPAPATSKKKKKRDEPEPEAGAKRKKKQQASGEAGTPKKKKGKKRDESAGTPHKEAASPKKHQSPHKSEKPASTPAKKQQQSGKSATPAKQQQSGKSATPAKQQKSSGKAEKPAAAATTPTKKKHKEDAKREEQQVAGGMKKSTPIKRKRGDAEPPKESRSPKGASGEGEAGALTPVKKKQKDRKAAVVDIGTCSFPMARVRQLMRAEDDTIRASGEAVFLINKASELFLEKFADDAYRNALKDRKKSIIYDNLSSTVCNHKGFKFLSDFVPPRLRAEDALKAAAASQS